MDATADDDDYDIIMYMLQPSLQQSYGVTLLYIKLLYYYYDAIAYYIYIYHKIKFFHHVLFYTFRSDMVDYSVYLLYYLVN